MKQDAVARRDNWILLDFERPFAVCSEKNRFPLPICPPLMIQVADIQRYSIICLLVLSICLGGYAGEQSTASQTESRGLGSLKLVKIARAPLNRIIKGGVFALRVSVRNTGSRPAIGQLVGRIAGQTGEEDRRQIELAGGEQRDFDLQLRLSASFKDTSVNAIITLNAIENGREVLLQQGDEPLSQTLRVPVDDERFATAISLAQEPSQGPYWRWPHGEAYAPYELVVGTRIDSGLSRRCMTIGSEPWPLNSAEWQGIDSIIIGNPETLKDAAALTSVQYFLQRGGRVLVMLELVDTDVVRDLLVHGQQCETVDTVELNHFVMDVRSPIPFSLSDRTIDNDKPMRMKRVLQQGGRVTHSIDGWPAVVSMKVGDGELLLTTLECSAWLKIRAVHQVQDARYQANFTVPLWGGTLTNELNAIRLTEPIEAVEFSYPLELIGTPVVSRKLVGVVLIGFCVLLASVGGWNAFSGDLKRIGVLAPVLALISSVPLCMAAMWSRKDIPSMVSELQFIQFWPNGGGLMRGNAAVYLGASRSMDLVGKSDGYAIPSENIESGIRCITTTDFQNWRLGNTDWPPGTWRYKTEIGLPNESFSVTAKLTATGAELELPHGLPSQAEDIVVSFTPGSPSLGNLIDQNNRLLVDGKLPAEANRWTTASIVSDEQGRRASVYNELFLPLETRRVPPLRTLYFWTKLWPQSPSWNTDLERRGAALVAVPIELATPDVGSDVLIPYPLIKIEAQEGNIAVSNIFKYRTGYWAGEASMETKADLAFVLPQEVVPLAASAINIDWDIEAPKRTVKLIWSANDSPVMLVELTSPSIPWTGTIDDPRVMQDLSDGRLNLRIEVTNGDGLENSSQNSYVSWRIKHLRISVSGKTLARNNLVLPVKK